MGDLVEFLDKHGGSGGFNLIAEADVPLYQTAGTPLANIPREPDGTLGAVPLRLRAGDDASCMNLFQASRPRILGVPDSLIERGGFKFYQTEASTDEEKANPWLLLQKPAPDDTMPVFCENNTAVWMLKTMVGGEITIPDDSGTDISQGTRKSWPRLSSVEIEASTRATDNRVKPSQQSWYVCRCFSRSRFMG